MDKIYGRTRHIATCGEDQEQTLRERWTDVQGCGLVGPGCER